MATLLVSMIGSKALAKDYKVEVLVFENLNASRATESHNYQEPRKMRSGSSVWSLKPSMLLEQAEALRKSPSYELKHHYSWGQESLRYSQSATYDIAEPGLHGAIKIYAEQLLFVNIDLDYDGYRMDEKRRLKLDEKHFFDHPKFGLLVQVSRLPKPQNELNEIESNINKNNHLESGF